MRSCNGIGQINKVELRRARLGPGLVTAFAESTIPVFCSPLSLVIPPLVGAMVLAMVSAIAGEEMASSV